MHTAQFPSPTLHTIAFLETHWSKWYNSLFQQLIICIPLHLSSREDKGTCTHYSKLSQLGVVSINAGGENKVNENSTHTLFYTHTHTHSKLAGTNIGPHTYIHFSHNTRYTMRG